MSKKKAIILDTSAFIAGFDPFAVDYELYTVPSIKKELADKSFSKLRFDAAAERGKIKVFEPFSPYLAKAKASSSEVGDANFLSEADIKVIALALQLKDDGYSPVIITDDYSIQNVAEKVGIGFASLTTLGIRFHLHWLLYCPACRKKYPPDYKSNLCEICGTHLKRKPLRKKQIEKDNKPR